MDAEESVESGQWCEMGMMLSRQMFQDSLESKVYDIKMDILQRNK